MRKGLREVKNGRSNLDGGLSVCLQNNVVLKQLKHIDEHIG